MFAVTLNFKIMLSLDLSTWNFVFVMLGCFLFNTMTWNLSGFIYDHIIYFELLLLPISNIALPLQIICPGRDFCLPTQAVSYHQGNYKLSKAH